MTYRINIQHENEPDADLDICGGNRKEIKKPVTISIIVTMEQSKYETITNLQDKIINIFE